jgi:hypothetical protein
MPDVTASTRDLGVDRHSETPWGVEPTATAERELFITGETDGGLPCTNCGHRHTFHARCSVHAANCGGGCAEPETVTEPQEPAAEKPIPVDATITSWLPGYVHVKRPGIFNLGDPTVWTWTTPDGTWVISYYRRLFSMSVLLLVGPKTNLTFSGDIAISMRRLHGVLAAMDAIEVPDA